MPVALTDSALMKRHNPKIAIALSAVLPGAGQIYNKKWWKVPIIYAGLGAAGYFIYDFATKTSLYSNEYKHRANLEFTKLNPNLKQYTNENLLSLKNYYRRNMEIAIAAAAIIYFLNIIDATVDAHLFYFDISNDLALGVQPYLFHNQIVRSFDKGVALTLKF